MLLDLRRTWKGVHYILIVLSVEQKELMEGMMEGLMEELATLAIERKHSNS
jgi:hypothetical protein